MTTPVQALVRRSDWMWTTLPAGLLVLVMAVAVLVRVAGPTSDSEASAAATTAVTALVVSGSSLSQAAAHEAMDQMGWSATVRTEERAGFTTALVPGAVPVPVALRQSAAGLAPDVVVLQGGEADNGASLELLTEAVVETIDYVRDEMPRGTRLVIIGPIPSPDAPLPNSFIRVNAHLKGIAMQNRVSYVDARSSGWTTESAPLAVELTKTLTRLGVRART